MLYFLRKSLLLFFLVAVGISSAWAQITYISPFTGNQGGGTSLFGEAAPLGGDIFLDWETFGSATAGAGQGSDCRVIVRGMTPNADAESLIASDVACTAMGIYNGENGNNDRFFVNLNVCNLPAGRYTIEIQCDESGGDYDNSTGGATAATTWNYAAPESPVYYYGGTAGACGVSDGLDNITEVGEGGVAGTPQIEYFNVGDADVYRTMVVINGLFFDMGKFQPGNPTLPTSLGDLEGLYDPACVGIGSFPAAGFCGNESLVLSGAEVNVTKRTDCGNADVTGNRLFYRVYPVGGTPPSYSFFNISFQDNCPNGYPGSGTAFPVGGSCQNLNGILDQRWQTTSAGVDLLALAPTAGNYMIDFYTETDIVDCGGAASTVIEGTYSSGFTTLSDFGDPCCDADAGNIIRPTGGISDEYRGLQKICIGDDLAAFMNDYTAADETDPGTTDYETTFILTDASGNIIQVVSSGDFDFSILGEGTYDVYALNYGISNTPNNIAAYLMGLSSGVADGIGSNVSEIIANDNDDSSDGAGTGAFCLDLDNLDNDGLDADSDTVRVLIVAEPIINSIGSTPFLVCDVDQTMAMYDVIADFQITTSPLYGMLTISGTNTTGTGTFDLSSTTAGMTLANFTLTYTDTVGCMTTLDLSYQASNAAGCDRLPVELVDFNATLVEEQVELNWTTATEENNSHFEVERSFDEVKFEKLIKVEGTVNALVPQTYTYTDTAPKAGVNYYRLKQVDLDGTFTYSAMQMVYFQVEKVKITLSPNPVSAFLQFSISGRASFQQPEITIYDTFGRVLSSRFDFDENTQVGTISTTELPAGLYFLMLRSDDENTYLERFVKH